MSQSTPPTIGFERIQIEGEDSTWELDKLNRKNSAHQLERLIACTKGPYVIAMTPTGAVVKPFSSNHGRKTLTREGNHSVNRPARHAGITAHPNGHQSHKKLV